MIDKIISLMTDFVPPIVLRCYRKAARKDFFTGKYATWEEAKQVSTGYDSDLILEKVRSSSLKIKNGEAVYERDSVLFDPAQSSCRRGQGSGGGARRHRCHRVWVDFGGSL